jgi:hypothetical protein
MMFGGTFNLDRIRDFDAAELSIMVLENKPHDASNDNTERPQQRRQSVLRQSRAPR